MPATLEDNLKHLSRVQEALEAEGITPESLAKKLAEELDAHETKVFHNKDTGVVFSDPVIAWDIRQKARMDAQKLLGMYPAEKRELSGPDGGPIEVHDTDLSGLSDEDLRRLTEVLEKVPQS